MILQRHPIVPRSDRQVLHGERRLLRALIAKVDEDIAACAREMDITVEEAIALANEENA